MAGAMTESNYPEELLHTAEQVSIKLASLGVQGEDARQIGWEIAEHLRTYWGGRTLYVRNPEQTDPRQMGLLDTQNTAPGLCQQEMFADIAEQIAERLCALAWLPDVAAQAGWEVAQHLAAYLGSGLLYICKGLQFELDRRNQEIYRRFNGDNHEWLAREYDLTVQHVYRIVKRVGDTEKRKRQAALFPGEAAA